MPNERVETNAAVQDEQTAKQDAKGGEAGSMAKEEMDLQKEKAETQTVETGAADANLNEPVIYLGPTIYPIVTTGRVFIEQPVPKLLKLIDACTAIGELLIPVSSAVAARKELADSSSRLTACYSAVLKFMEER